MAVPEFQLRGAVHYHLVIDLPFDPVEVIRQLWPYGFIKINKIYNPAKVGWYLAKYLAKNVADPRFAHHRCFSSSQNLTQPRMIYGDEIADVIQQLESAGYSPSYHKTYLTEWCGEISYSSYNLYEPPPAQK